MSRKRRKRRKKYQNDGQSENNDADAGAGDDDAGGAAEEAAEAEEATEEVVAEAGESDPEQAELVEEAGEAEEAAEEAAEAAEVVPAEESKGAVPGAPEQAERVEEAKTYQIEENGVTYQIQPRVLSGGRTQWTIVAFLPSVQGPVLQGERIPDDAADDLGLSRQTQDMLNTAVEKANERLGLPSSLRGEERERAPLSDLQDALGD